MNDENVFDDTQPETNNLDSPHTLDHIFSNPNILLVENKKITTTPCITQTSFVPWIKTLWDPSPLTFKHEPNDTTNTDVYTFD